MGVPPVELGAVHASAIWGSPRVAVRPAGEPGTAGGATGVAEAGVDGGPVPTAFVALTMNVYSVPLVSPVIVQPRVVVAQVAPPGFAVAVYPVIGLPPVDDGALHARAIWPLPEVAARPVGAPGTVAGVADTSDDPVPAPTAFVAVT